MLIHPDCGRRCDVYEQDFKFGELIITPHGQAIIDADEGADVEAFYERNIAKRYGVRVDH